MEKTFIQKILSVQCELKAPKGQFNKFGNYAFRSCEDILEAVKPLLKAQGLLLFLTDEIIMVGDRYYVKATATVTDGNESLSNNGNAREEENKKGADQSQITGASSSYARKYALNGLFCIDDNKDSDATNNGEKKEQTLEYALACIAAANDYDSLVKAWNKYKKSFGKNEEVIKAFKASPHYKAKVKKDGADA